MSIELYNKKAIIVSLNNWDVMIYVTYTHLVLFLEKRGQMIYFKERKITLK